MILLIAAVVALVLANSPVAASYHSFWELSLAGVTLHQFVNEGLMAIFFFAVGLEIKREIKTGQLSNLKAAALPIAAAIGGMIVPAAIYALLNRSGPAARGWGIPMATDIAFTLGVVAMLGKRVPAGLKVFLMALAVIDDLGALIVIALFYSPSLHLSVIGAVVALLMPESMFKYEHSLQKFSALLIMPVFALANAGVSINAGIAGMFDNMAGAGIILGLTVGKSIGITLFAWLAVRFGLAQLPPGASWRQLHGVAWLGGIGFTISLFIASLAFEKSDLFGAATLAVLAGSLLSAITGVLVLIKIKGS